MDVKTHELANPNLLGTPIKIVTGKEANVELLAVIEMAVDARGLIHGGFTFGLADYAAMLAVNQPFVVLVGSKCKFLSPVRVGDNMIAQAKVTAINDRRWDVDVDVCVGDERVFTGIFNCYVLDNHVLL
jgi:acyl-coenzyme A thioesterase PaaI-like protein